MSGRLTENELTFLTMEMRFAYLRVSSVNRPVIIRCWLVSSNAAARLNTGLTTRRSLRPMRTRREFTSCSALNDLLRCVHTPSKSNRLSSDPSNALVTISINSFQIDTNVFNCQAYFYTFNQSLLTWNGQCRWILMAIKFTTWTD